MTEDKPIFILHGSGSLLNRGCEAILKSTIAIMEREFGPCRFVNYPPYHLKTEDLEDCGSNVINAVPGERIFPNRNWFDFHIRKRLFMFTLTRQISGFQKQAFKSFLPHSTASLAIGGDNFSLDYGVPWTQFAINRATLRCCKPLIIWGASVGPFSKNPKFERFATSELKKVSLICARESETVSYLDSLGISDNVRLIADPAFVLEPHEVDLSNSELDIIKESCIGINMSYLIGKYWQGSGSWLDCATDNIKSILENTDSSVLLVPHVVQPRNNDYHFMKQIISRLKPYNKRLAILDPALDCQEIKWIISKLRIFVGARTHATIAALSSNVPAISIGYSMKAQGINKDVFGHLDWLVPFEQLEGNMLTNAVKRLLEAESVVREHLSEHMPVYKEKAWNAAKLIKEVI
jgi:polysaccharide pyruvyl transferase WcaK-like protein